MPTIGRHGARMPHASGKTASTCLCVEDDICGRGSHSDVLGRSLALPVWLAKMMTGGPCASRCTHEYDVSLSLCRAMCPTSALSKSLERPSDAALVAGFAGFLRPQSGILRPAIQHTDERAGSSGEQGSSEGAGQADGKGQARHEAGQAISKNNLTEERSPGATRTNQHVLDDDATQSTSTAISAATSKRRDGFHALEKKHAQAAAAAAGGG